MEYTVNAEMTKTEYYKMFFRDYLFLYIICFFISFHIGNEHIGYSSLFSIEFLREYWHIVLYNWFIVLLIVETMVLTMGFVFAFIKRHKYLSKKKYTFTEESVHIQTEVSKRTVSWDKLVRVKNKRTYTELTFKNLENIYLLDSFFADTQQKNEILSFIQKMKEEHS